MEGHGEIAEAEKGMYHDVSEAVKGIYMDGELLLDGMVFSCIDTYRTPLIYDHMQHSLDGLKPTM